MRIKNKVINVRVTKTMFQRFSEIVDHEETTMTAMIERWIMAEHRKLKGEDA